MVKNTDMRQTPKLFHVSFQKMEEFTRLFFQGEPLQRMFSCLCNNLNRGMQYKICNVICSMLKTTICIRLTPVGLAPFRNDITMIMPYSMMDSRQLDFLERIISTASFDRHSSMDQESTQAVMVGNEVMVVTVLEGCRIWSTPNQHQNPNLNQHEQGGGGGAKKKSMLMHEEASRMLYGRPCASSSQLWQLDTLEVLKSFAACVFRSKVFEDNNVRHGICNIVVQMVVGEMSITRDTLDQLGLFMKGLVDCATVREEEASTKKKRKNNCQT